MRSWEQIFATLDVDPAKVCAVSSLTRRDFYRAGGMGRLYFPVARPQSPPPPPPVVEEIYPALLLPKAKKILTPAEADAQLLNEAIFEKLSSHDPAAEKQAIDKINDFTRAKMKEDGFFRKILPPVPIPNWEAIAGGITQEILADAIALIPQTPPEPVLFGVDWVKSPSAETPSVAMLETDETQAALAEAQVLTAQAATRDAQRLAAAFWAEFRRYRRKPQ